MDEKNIKSVITIEKPYTFRENVISRNRFAVMCLMTGLIINTFYMYFEFEDVFKPVLKGHTFSEQVILFVVGYFSFSLIFSIVVSGVLSALSDVLKNPRVFILSLLTVFGALLILVIGAIKGIFKFAFQFMRIPINLIIWISTKVSKRAYQYFTEYETFYL